MPQTEIESGFQTRDRQPCEDCNLRGDLDSMGYPLKKARGRIRKCEPCNGKGYIVLTGKASADPYTRPW